jgi:phage terminase large subunit-like protein
MINQADARKLLAEIAEYEKNNSLKTYNKEKIHLKQMDFHSSKKRNKWLLGGNRTGKTVGGAVEAVWRARGIHPYAKNKPTRGWVVSLSNEVQRDVAQKEILKWLHPSWIKEVSVRTGKKDDLENAVIDYLVVENVFGSTSLIGFKSCDQGRAKFQGTSQDWVWFDEEPPKEIYDECRMRIIDTRGYMWGTMTPLMGLTWVYDIIYLNERKDENIQYWFMEWDDNPYLNKAEIKELESSMDEDEREARQYGRFVAMSGLIYKEFKEDIHVIDPFNVPEDWYSNISIDPGYTNPLSCHFYAINYDGDIFVIDEHYKKETSVEDHSRIINFKAAELNWPREENDYLFSLIDSAANQHTLQNEKSVVDLFLENGIICSTGVNKDVWTGIERVRNKLKLEPHPDIERWPKGKPKLFIFRNCAHMIREIKSYRWAESKPGVNSKEEPKKSNDHAMDELRYFVMSDPQPRPQYTHRVGFYSESELEDLGISGGMEIVGSKHKRKAI